MKTSHLYSTFLFLLQIFQIFFVLILHWLQSLYWIKFLSFVLYVLLYFHLILSAFLFFPILYIIKYHQFFTYVIIVNFFLILNITSFNNLLLLSRFLFGFGSFLFLFVKLPRSVKPVSAPNLDKFLVDNPIYFDVSFFCVALGL